MLMEYRFFTWSLLDSGKGASYSRDLVSDKTAISFEFNMKLLRSTVASYQTLVRIEYPELDLVPF
jgi:hypothetical protein